MVMGGRPSVSSEGRGEVDRWESREGELAQAARPICVVKTGGMKGLTCLLRHSVVQSVPEGQIPCHPTAENSHHHQRVCVCVCVCAHTHTHARMRVSYSEGLHGPDECILLWSILGTACCDLEKEQHRASVSRCTSGT